MDTKHTDKDRPADPRARGSSGRRSPWTCGVHPGLAGHPLPPPFPPRPALSFLHLSSSASSVRVVGERRHVTVARTAEEPSSRKATQDCRESTAIVPESSSQKAARGAPPCLGGGSQLTLTGRGGALRSDSVGGWRIILEQPASPGWYRPDSLFKAAALRSWDECEV